MLINHISINVKSDNDMADSDAVIAGDTVESIDFESIILQKLSEALPDFQFTVSVE